ATTCGATATFELAGACVVAGCVGVTDELVGFEAVTFWRRWSTTAGLFVFGFDASSTSIPPCQASAGAGVVVGVVAGVVAGVLATGVEVVVGCVLVVSSPAAWLGVVVVAPASEEPLAGGSAASAAEIGPSPAAVNPPPARADSSARQAHLRVP
ncbi:MAG TPA: hypothetical protein VGH21_03630, partial [Solirubrobacteraceae bacterium]